MRFAAASSSITKLEGELQNLLGEVEAKLGGVSPHLATVFFSSHFEDEAQSIVAEVCRRYPNALLAGCSAESVIGGEQEREYRPSIAVMLAELPGVKLQPFHIGTAQMEMAESPESWREAVGVDAASCPTLLFLGDPFTVPMNPVLDAFTQTYPGRPLLGGMASGCERPGQAALMIGDQVHREGCCGIAISGRVQVDAVVSQGCRPIGHPLVITKCERNVIRGLGGRPALERLREIVEQLPERDAALARQALFIGRVVNEYKETFSRGDFLIRHLMGYDPGSGALMVSDVMRVGATVQFHVRDADSADEDLRQMLATHSGAAAPAGVLLFSCNGRGTRMWSQPHHDVSTVRQVCGDVPVAGFFAAGEIGPIGARNFIHGHTASMALFKPMEPNQ